MPALHPTKPLLNNGWVYRDRISAQIAGMTVLAFYTNTYPHSTSDTWLERLETGLVQLNGSPVQPDHLLEKGDELSYHRPPWREPTAPETFELLYCDDYLLAVDKPAGLQVLPGGPFLERTLLALVRRHLDPEATPVHRLGRGTSGTVLFARTTQTRRHLAGALRQRQMIKTYRALAQGLITPGQGSVDIPIGRIFHPKLGHLHAAVDQGKPALTQWRCLERRPDLDQSLLAVNIPTGRPHQIRIHLAALGHPLVGDPLYLPGGRPRLKTQSAIPRPGDCGYLLHALEIRFTHPADARPMSIGCPPPPILQQSYPP